MEVIVVSRTYYNYEDSYTKILGVVSSEEKADHLIEVDKHKDDVDGMSVTEFNEKRDAYWERLSELNKNEKGSPKKDGWIYRFNYNSLTKQQKVAYDILKAHWEELGKPHLNNFTSNELYKGDYNYYMQILLMFSRSTVEELKKTESDFWGKEDPEDISYKKETFAVQ